MSDDLLERMTKALREEGGPEPTAERSAQVRARVLAQSKRRAQLRPQGMWQWAAVICLGFFVSTAMAQVIRVQLPKVIEALREAPAQLPAALKKPKPAKKPKPVAPPAVAPEQADNAANSGAAEQALAPSAAPLSAPVPVAALGARPGQGLPVPSSGAAQQPVARSAVPAPASAAPDPAAAASGARPSLATTPSGQAQRERPRSVKVARTPVAAPHAIEVPVATRAPDEVEPVQPTEPPPSAAKTPAPESAELALFRRAQALHLERDARAIEAWDAYLRVAPSSALAPEARYNRALGLVRANRFAEAKRALLPFAEGKYGAYRREEAQALLVRLPR